MRMGGPGRARLRTCPSLFLRMLTPQSLPRLPSHLCLPSPLYQLAMAMILSLILRWWIVPLPFTWIYIYILTDTAKDPRSPPEPKEGTPTGQCRDDDCCNFWFYLSKRNLNTWCFIQCICGTAQFYCSVILGGHANCSNMISLLCSYIFLKLCACLNYTYLYSYHHIWNTDLINVHACMFQLRLIEWDAGQKDSKDSGDTGIAFYPPPV